MIHFEERSNFLLRRSSALATNHNITIVIDGLGYLEYLSSNIKLQITLNTFSPMNYYK